LTTTYQNDTDQTITPQREPYASYTRNGFVSL
jgi:hypothetical protein